MQHFIQQRKKIKSETNLKHAGGSIASGNGTQDKLGGPWIVRPLATENLPARMKRLPPASGGQGQPWLIPTAWTGGAVGGEGDGRENRAQKESIWTVVSTKSKCNDRLQVCSYRRQHIHCGLAMATLLIFIMPGNGMARHQYN
jgi:hypothetical protein